MQQKMGPPTCFSGKIGKRTHCLWGAARDVEEAIGKIGKWTHFLTHFFTHVMHVFIFQAGYRRWGPSGLLLIFSLPHKGKFFYSFFFLLNRFADPCKKSVLLLLNYSLLPFKVC